MTIENELLYLGEVTRMWVVGEKFAWNRPGERKMTAAQAGREGIVRTGRRVLTASRFAEPGNRNSHHDFES